MYPYAVEILSVRKGNLPIGGDRSLVERGLPFEEENILSIENENLYECAPLQGAGKLIFLENNTENKGVSKTGLIN